MRQNTEERWWSDPRRMKLAMRLAGDLLDIDLAPFVADGIVLNAWKLAERFWIPDKQLIPLHDWEAAGIPEAFFEVKLAERRPGGIYVKGTEDACQWWFDDREQRIEAGKRSAERRRDTRGRLLPRTAGSAKPPTAAGEKSNGVGKTANSAQRGPARPNDVQPSGSCSSSSTSKERTSPPADAAGEGGSLSENSGPTSEGTAAPPSNLVEEVIYARYPLKKGKAKGLRSLRAQATTWAKFALLERAVKNYAFYHARTLGKDPLGRAEFREGMMHFDTWADPDVWVDWIEPDEAVLYGPAGKPAVPREVFASTGDTPPEPMTVEMLEKQADLLEAGDCRNSRELVASFRRVIERKRLQMEAPG
jgi:hypothetical protein